MSAHSAKGLNNPHLLGRESLRRGDIAAAVQAFEQAAKIKPDSLPIAFDLGRAYGALGRFRDAKAQLERATAWPGHESQTYLALGYTLGELADWRAAARAMLVVLRAAPGHLQALGSLSECAHRLARQGEPVPRNLQSHEDPSAGQLQGTISVIVCSIDRDKLGRLQTNLETLLRGEDWELIHIADARSLCEGYNRGVARSRGEILVFCHDDIAILCADFARRLRMHLASFDLLGVAGSTLASGPTWTWSGAPHIFASIAYPRSDGTDQLQLATCGTSGPVVKDAQLLDGVFMAARRDLLHRVSFDEATFDGFHLYDLDFSYRAWIAGAKTAVCRDVAIRHESRGNFKTADYRHYAERFRRKFPNACRSPAAGKTSFAEIVIEKPGQLQPTIDWLNYFSARPAASADVV
jgi:tetratricopeptide (TPR) repeat protein